MTKEMTQKEMLEKFIAACKQKGLKVTHQRVEIFKTLAATKEHPDVDTIYNEVRERIPTISLDTVYRTLRTLVQHDLIQLVQVSPERMRFDANTEPHYHFICTDSGRVIDLDVDPIDVEIPSALKEMAEIHSVNIEFRGTLHK